MIFARCLRYHNLSMTEHGHKELVAVRDGYRESSASWEELVTSLRQRSLLHLPKLAATAGVKLQKRGKCESGHLSTE